MNGKIIKAKSGVFTVKYGDKTIDCTPKGNFKIKGTTLLVGDNVEFDESEKVILKTLKRKNDFIRPAVCNIDAINIVVSTPPKPDYSLVDKLLAVCNYKCVEAMITVNKTDITDEIYKEILKNYGNLNVKIFTVSATNGDGIKELKETLKGKLTAFAGQSAVGKTSLVNALFGVKGKVGELSDKIQRGKNTTAYSEIFSAEGCEIIDTAGFSALYCDMDEESFIANCEDYFALSLNCRFRGCTHTNEPDCAVKKAVEDNVLSKDRYERYLNILKEIKESKKHYE